MSAFQWGCLAFVLAPFLQLISARLMLWVFWVGLAIALLAIFAH
jgi:uncharacterized metal-binding protein